MLKRIPIALCFMSSAASALVVDEETFARNGGDLSNIAKTITSANHKLREQSFSKAWLAVGSIGNCTATWIGDKDLGKESWSYFVTAARCLPQTTEETLVSKTFTAWNGVVTASGTGVAHIPRGQLEGQGPSTDISILRLPKVTAMVDQAGNVLEPPLLNNSPDEKDQPVIFVGHGAWGVGLRKEPEQQSAQVPPLIQPIASRNPVEPGQRPLYDPRPAMQFEPESGARRLYGRSVIDRFIVRENVVSADFVPDRQSTHWARLAPGDTGSAMWQILDKKPVIVAVATSSNDRSSYGVRVSKWVDWIKTILPEARFLSDVKPRGCIVNTMTGQQFCLQPGQIAERLPDWIRGQRVYVQADNGVAVVLSDKPNVPLDRIATFMGTVVQRKLRGVRANNGVERNFGRPRSMSVHPDSQALGCIVSLTSGDKFCLPAGGVANSLPQWIKGHDVYVEADAGAAVMLSDVSKLARNRVAVFSGRVGHEHLKRVPAYSGQSLDFSRPRSMRVDRE